MIKIKFKNEEILREAELSQINKSIVQLLGEISENISGFHTYKQNGVLIGDFTEYTTVYKMVDGGVQFSNDGSVYAEPEPVIPTVTFTSGYGGCLDGELRQQASDYGKIVIPSVTAYENYEFTGWHPAVPESGTVEADTSFHAGFSYIPTLEEVKEEKTAEMNVIQQEVIQAGVDVTMTDGTRGHFTLTEHDQTSLMGLQTQVARGAGQIPWHTSDHTEHCRYYSNADMALIVTAAMRHVTFHVTYFRDLRIYINSLQDKETVAAVTYGMIIPEQYRSEVLADMYAAMEVMDEERT